MAHMILTDLDFVKRRLFDDVTVTKWDDLLDGLTEAISRMIEDECDREFGEDTYTEYYDGNGRTRLYLRQGPLVSVTSVQKVEYSTDSDTGVLVETLTTVDAGDYLLGGQRSEGHELAGWLDIRSGTWTEGTRNYRIIYDAGFDDDPDAAGGVPLGLVEQATRIVCAEFNVRDMDGLTSVEVGDSQKTSIPRHRLDEAFRRAVAPWRLGRY